MSLTPSRYTRCQILVVLACALLAACNKVLDVPKENSIQSAYTRDLQTLDPAKAASESAQDLLPAVYETLYQYSYLEEHPKLVPLLAAELPTVSKDRLTVKIPIRKGVLFHDSSIFKDQGGRGRELTAKDVVYSIKRLAHPGLKANVWNILEGRIVGMNILLDQLTKAPEQERLAVLDGAVEGLTASDLFTVKLQLTKPFPELAHVLTMLATAIVPPELVKQNADVQGQIQNQAVGSGPFVLAKWMRGEQVVLDRNLTFHESGFPTNPQTPGFQKQTLNDAAKPLPLVEQLRFHILTDEQNQWDQLVAGRLNFIRVLSHRFGEFVRTQRPQILLLERQGYQLITQKQPSIYYLAVNMKDPVLGMNKLLRQALSAAIERKKIAQNLLSGLGEAAHSFLPEPVDPRDRKRDLKSQQLKYGEDLELAKKLFAQAGFALNQSVLSLKIEVSDSDLFARQLAEKLKADLEKLGLRVLVFYHAYDAFLKKIAEGDYQLALGGWDADYLDPQSIFQLFYGPSKSPGINTTLFDHPQYNALYEKYALLESSYQRRKFVDEMEAILQEELPWIPLFYPKDVIFVGPSVRNLYDSLKNTYRYKYVQLEQVSLPSVE